MEKVTCTKCQGKGFLMEDTQKKAEKANQKIKAKEIQDDDPDDIKEMKKYKSVYKATTLIEILEFGYVTAGPDKLRVDYLNNSFVADLNKDGTISFFKEENAPETTFKSLSAFAVHCYRIPNPSRRSVDGWTAVKYDDGRLMADVKHDYLASIYSISTNTNKSKTSRPAKITAKPKTEGIRESPRKKKLPETEPSTPVTKKVVSKKSPKKPAPKKSPKPSSKPRATRKASSKTKKRKLDLSDEDDDSEIDKFYAHDVQEEVYINTGTTSRGGSTRARGGFVDPLEMISCSNFSTRGRNKGLKQPFATVLRSNALAVIDFHSHLTNKEVIGYLGGSYDGENNELLVECAYPCKSLSTDDNSVQVEMDPDSEMEVRERIAKHDRVIVGWYHSHPEFRPDPSHRDIENQAKYQQLFKKENGSQPFIGIIASPYHSKEAPAILNCFWTHGADDGADVPYQVLMDIEFDDDLQEEALQDMKNVAQYINDEFGLLDFSAEWENGKNMYDKLKDAMKGHITNDATLKKINSLINSL